MLNKEIKNITANIDQDCCTSDNPHKSVRVAVVCAIDLSVKALLQPQIEAMTEAGYNVVVICSDGSAVPKLRAQGLNIITTPILRKISPWQDVKTVLALKKIFLDEQIDIVHTHTPKAALLAQIAAKLAKTPIRINTLHGLYYLAKSSRLARWIYKKFEISACKMSTFVLSQSQEDVDMILEEKLLPPEKIRWLGNGIDIDKFSLARFPTETRSEVRSELKIPEDAFVVGIVARMVTEKGFGELFEAFAKFRKQAPNAYLLHIGFIDQSRGDEVTPALAETMGIGDFCRFVGQRDDIPRLMTGIDIYCLPSYREGYPRSVMEANAMSLPAIVTDIRGCREAVQEGVNGLQVPVRNADALCDAMRTLHDDAELRAQLAEGARTRAQEEFDERRVKGIVLETYAELLAKRSE
jgi:glycosyltransferase involved in cell wall biosynthesis